MTRTAVVRDRGRAVGYDVPVWTREQFLEYWGREYRAGQHVTEIGPTQRGKTFTCQQMLGECISPDLPCLILAGKPPDRDKTMAEASEKLGLQLVETWPPPIHAQAKRWLLRKTTERPRINGWLLRPHHSLTDSDADDANMGRQFKRAMQDAYAGKLGRVIVVADETKLIYDLGLKKQHEDILTRGAPIVSIWSLLQRGRFVTYYAYDMPEHVFFFWDDDLANVKRYAEMVGGVDPQLIVMTMKALETRENADGMTNSEIIYYRRSGSRVVIIQL